ncbi:MAG: hypothetical protein N2C14_03775 [Planctomycetales bacterium]
MLEGTPHSEHWQSQWHTIHWFFQPCGRFTYVHESNTAETVAPSKQEAGPRPSSVRRDPTWRPLFRGENQRAFFLKVRLQTPEG